MEVFYYPYSANGQGIADRRRMLYWSKHRNVNLIMLDRYANLPPNARIVISSSSDLVYWSNYKKEYPDSEILLDVVDGIHGETSAMKDLLRGFSKVLSGRISGRPTSMKRIISRTVGQFSGIICSSPEQAQLWRNFYKGHLFDILDFHEEIPRIQKGFSNKTFFRERFFWEGLPYTLDHISILKEFFYEIKELEPSLDVYTSFNSFKYLGRFGQIDPYKIVKNSLGDSGPNCRVHPWSLENLAAGAMNAGVGLIPVRPDRGYDFLKAENRLLIMWRLGLPTLTSPLPSYLRVEEKLGLPFVCHTKDEWVTQYMRIVTDNEYRNQFMSKVEIYLNNFHSKDLLLSKWDEVFSTL